VVAGGERFDGLYKGVVVSNIDELQLGRLLVSVQDVLGGQSLWAEASTPLAGISSGQYVIPLVNSGVWVQFVNGDADRAVWTGFWRGGTGDVPTAAKAATPGTAQVVIGTPGQNVLVLSDVPGPTGGILLQLHGTAGPYIRLSETGVEIGASASGPTIKVTAAGIDIGNNALFVLPG
jgi:Type VI secretion system/phage-baseplate injector OB domain